MLSGVLDEWFLATTSNKPQKWLGILWGLIAFNDNDMKAPEDKKYLQLTKHPVSASAAAPISLP